MRPRLRWGQKPWWQRLHPRWIAVAAAVTLLPGLAAAAVLVPRAAAHPDAATPTPSPSPSSVAGGLVVEPTPPLLDAAAVAAAAKRPPASAPLQRLPQVDLNGLAVSGIPRAALAAYVTAAKMANREDASCHLRWWLVGGIGLVESGHARSGGSAAANWNGVAKPPIYGPVLDGSHGFGQIPDSDHGTLDHNARWDRAVGPMQFLPSTWVRWGADAKGRMLDPQDIRAAALAAGRYLCASSADLATPAGMASAVYSYNHSWAYVHLVLSVAARYAGLDPNALGVDRLPTDQPTDAKKKHKKKGAAKPNPKASSSSAAQASPASSSGGSSSGGSSSGSSGGSSSQPSSSPSPSPSSGGGGGGGGGGGIPIPLPSPSPTGPGLGGSLGG